jgi:hypothetical protein
MHNVIETNSCYAIKVIHVSYGSRKFNYFVCMILILNVILVQLDSLRALL